MFEYDLVSEKHKIFGKKEDVTGNAELGIGAML